jgi:hypothetical protein
VFVGWSCNHAGSSDLLTVDNFLVGSDGSVHRDPRVHRRARQAALESPARLGAELFGRSRVDPIVVNGRHATEIFSAYISGKMIKS